MSAPLKTFTTANTEAVKGWTTRSYIYFMWAIGSGKIKIGRSVNPLARISEISTGCPFEVEMLAIMPETWKTPEIRLHKAFSHLKIEKKKTEWFYAEDDLLEFIAHIRAGQPPVGYLENLEQRRGLYGYKKKLKYLELSLKRHNPVKHQWVFDEQEAV